MSRDNTGRHPRSDGKLYQVTVGVWPWRQMNLATMANNRSISTNLLVQATTKMREKGWIDEHGYSPQGAVHTRITQEGFAAVDENRL